MGNGIGKLNLCFAGDAGEMSLRRHDIAVCLSDPLDEGLGHSFCYIRPDASSKTQFPDEPTAAQAPGTAFRTISGASISANASTPLTTSLVDIGPPYGNSTSSLDKASAFESSNLFSSIPLQPIPRNSVSSARSGPITRFSSSASGPIGKSCVSDSRYSISSVRSGPIPRLSCSGLVEGGFLSGPIERSFISGPLENQADHLQRYRTKKSKKWASFNSFKKAVTKSLSGSRVLSWPVKHNRNNNGISSSGSNGNTNSVSSRASCAEADDEDENNEVQWAQGKAGEDRVHIVISEEHGWVYVGIYDGFNGPDATDFLLNNLYSNVYKELKGLLWHDKSEASENSASNESTYSSCDKDSSELGRDLREKLNILVLGCGDDHHSEVLKALSEGLRKTEESYLEIADMMVMENPELALMGSCVLVMLMKGEDVYLMNVGDSRAVLARKAESDRWIAKAPKDLEPVNDVAEAFDNEFDSLHNLTSCQLTTDHCTSVKEEVQRIKSEHPDDMCAVVNNRVKGSLKVTRAFGAGFLKQPKWNSALLQRFRIDYVGTSPYINCSPSLHHRRLSSQDKFLILSSDGLYQYFTNEEAVSDVEIFMSTFPEGDPAQHLVEEVLFRAAEKAGMDFHELLDITQGDRRKYHDDVSIIIISFEGRIWRSFV